MNEQDIIKKLIKALYFYANPETYHAISFLADHPCGGFIKDFSIEEGSIYDRPIPGATARRLIEELVDEGDTDMTIADLIKEVYDECV